MHVSNPLPGVPPLESPFSRDWIESLPRRWQPAAQSLSERGYAIFDFPEAEFDPIADGIRDRLGRGFDLDTWRRYGHGLRGSLRLQDAWRDDEGVLALAVNAEVIAFLSALYGRRAWPFQTLNFPVGTQQHIHSDTAHFSSLPEGFMCGVWVALEDIGHDQGPLTYYPGSHRWPRLANHDLGIRLTEGMPFPTQEIYDPVWDSLVEHSGARPEVFAARKGQALLWAANLLHGGATQANPGLTRWSQVTHYYFDDCTYWTPMHSDLPGGRIAFRNPVDISTGRRMPDLPRSLPEDFDAHAYLEANPDVKEARVAADVHWLTFGRREGRRLR